VLRRAKDGSPLVIENRFGRGTVVFNTDPIELHSSAARRESDLTLYRQVLAKSEAKTIRLAPDDPFLHAFRVPMRDGGQVYVLFNTDDSQPAKTITLADCTPPFSLSVASTRPALLWFDGHRALRAVEAQGTCNVGGRLVIEDQTGGMVLSLDQRDIPRSRALLFMPLGPGVVRIAAERRWQEATILTGDIHEGQWRTCDRAPAERDPHDLLIKVTPDQTFSLLLVTEASSAPKWCQAIGRAMTAPASLP
jgi:hypothetical protein